MFTYGFLTMFCEVKLNKTPTPEWKQANRWLWSWQFFILIWLRGFSWHYDTRRHHWWHLLKYGLTWASCHTNRYIVNSCPEYLTIYVHACDVQLYVTHVFIGQHLCCPHVKFWTGREHLCQLHRVNYAHTHTSANRLLY